MVVMLARAFGRFYGDSDGFPTGSASPALKLREYFLLCPSISKVCSQMLPAMRPLDFHRAKVSNFDWRSPVRKNREYFEQVEAPILLRRFLSDILRLMF